MKVLYLTVPSFFDLEISLIRELSKLVDIHVLMIVQPESMRSSAFTIDALDKRCSIIPSSEYKGMDKYSDMIEFSKWSIANNPDSSLNSCISLARQIKSFYKKGGFDVLHSTTDCKTALMLMPFAKSIKHTLYTTHDPIPHKKPSWARELICHRLLYKAMKHHLFLSDALVDPFCKRYKVTKDRIHFSHLSVYDFLRYYKETHNEYGKYMLFFGRIDYYKGVDVLIDAYEQSEARKNGWKLVIAGKGTFSHDKTSLCEGIVLLNKYIDNEDLANLIRHSSFVVLPYISATQSGCVMSAFAFNKPILATRVGDLPKEVVDGETGLICNPNDVMDLQIKMDTMATSDLQNYEELLEKKYASGSEYSWESASRSIVTAYNQISSNE